MNTFSRAFLSTFTALMTLTACDAPTPSRARPPIEDITALLDPAVIAATDRAVELSRPGSSTVRKSLRPGDASIMARFLIAEAARQPEAELRAIVGVIRARYDSNRYGSTVLDVLLYNRDGTWAFTAADPHRANGDLLWGAGVVGSRRHKRMLALVNDEWTRAQPPQFDHYFHPAAMQPKGTTPRWAKGKKLTKIGDAVFCACGG